MKDYLQKRREELKKRGNKGFTLMEMLIVVAIIAVLIAIAIPVFTSQLENAREATDAANIRSAYAEVTAKALTSNTDQTATVTLTQTQNEWQNTSIKEIAGVKVGKNTGELNATAGGTVTIQYTASTGKVTIGGIEAKTSFMS